MYLSVLFFYKEKILLISFVFVKLLFNFALKRKKLNAEEISLLHHVDKCLAEELNFEGKDARKGRDKKRE